jgi:hypothetical protein
MNERIKELAVQAREYAHEQVAMMDNTYLRAFEDKFAELIVRECAEFVENEIEVAGYKVKRILEHFGVEE